MQNFSLGCRVGSVGIGDLCIFDGNHDYVSHIVALPPDPARDTLTVPVVAHMWAVVVTSNGGHRRYVGGINAWIGSDLAMHWER
jgi:hypothetical protein